MQSTRVATLLFIAGFIGLAMVTLGFLFGLLKEYFHHHPRGVIGKTGGILFAWGIAWVGLSVLHTITFHQLAPGDSLRFPVRPDPALPVGGLLLMVFGEGIQTSMMGLIEVLSHILSYTRLLGILLATSSSPS